MKKIFLLITIFFSIGVFAQERYVKATGGPYITNVTKTGFTVIWTTNMDAVSWVEIAPDDGTHFYNTERKCFYDNRGFGRRPITKTHKVRVTGLQSGTTYRYRAMMKGVLEQDHRKSIIYTEGYGMDLKKYPTKITTLKDDYDKVSFAVVNDVHSQDSVFRELFKDAKGKYDFVCFNGDMSSAIDFESDIMSGYMKSAAELFGAYTPIHFVRGNHEYRGNDALTLMNYIDTPTGKTYYTFNYGDFFFIALDCGEDKHDTDIRNLDIMRTEQYLQEQSEWLKTVIQSPEFKNSKVRIAFCHMQPNPIGWYGNAAVSKYLVPVLNQGGIDLMLSGHIHKFREYPIGSTNAEFPVVCNANLERLVATITDDKISIDIFKASGEKTRSLIYKTGR